MNDPMTTLIARLHRAGSENSKQTEEFRTAIDTLLRWIKDNVYPMRLPCNCEMFPSGEFVRTELSNPPHGTHREILHITIGHRHTVVELNTFARLIADGFLERLCEELEGQSKSFKQTGGRIQSFLKK